jgi:VWFA-related protein
MSSAAFRLRLYFLLITIIFCSGDRLIAQQDSSPSQAQPSNLVIKSVVRRVILDVVVTGPDGKAVHGLTQKDFAVNEDGNPQRILSFDVHDLEEASDFAKVPPLPPNTFVNVPTMPERGPLYVLLLDLVNTDTSDEPYARRQLLNFISAKPQGTRFAIYVLSDGLHLVQGFTDDQKQLYAVLDPAHPRPHLPRIFLYQNNNYRHDPGLMIEVFNYIGQYLQGLPGRKNLIWFSGEFPMQLFPSDGDPSEYRDEVKAALDTLAEGQIAIYPVDVRGVIVENPYAPSGNTGGGGLTSDYRSGGSPAGSGGATQPVSSAPAPQTSFGNTAQAAGGPGYALIPASYMNQDEIAKTTGGHAFHSNNGLKDLLEQVVEDGANYYTLTYAPSNNKFDGSLRSIKVEISGKGYELAYRRSYYADDPDLSARPVSSHASGAQPQPPARKSGDSLAANMQHGAPMAHQIVFRAHVHALGVPALATPEQMANLAEAGFFVVRHKNRPAKPMPPIKLQTYAIDFAVPAPSGNVANPNARTVAVALEIAAAAFDAEGIMLNGVIGTSGAAVPAKSGETAKPGLLRAQQQIEVPLNATSIRVAVRDISTDRIGTLEVALPLAPEPQTQAATPAQSDSTQSGAAEAVSPKPN